MLILKSQIYYINIFSYIPYIIYTFETSKIIIKYREYIVICKNIEVCKNRK